MAATDKLFVCDNCTPPNHPAGLAAYASEDGTCPKCGLSPETWEPDQGHRAVRRVSRCHLIIKRADGLLSLVDSLGRIRKWAVACDPVMAALPQHAGASVLATTCPECRASPEGVMLLAIEAERVMVP